jgi:hypothetical protein
MLEIVARIHHGRDPIGRHDLGQPQHQLGTPHAPGQNDDLVLHRNRSSMGGRMSADAGDDPCQTCRSVRQDPAQPFRRGIGVNGQ